MIDVAITAAKAGGKLALKYFKTGVSVKYKADESPVSVADVQVEKLIRKYISKKFKNHGIIGEELPPTNPKAQYQWVIDPIDGTRDFVKGVPFWAVFIAVLKNGKPIIGVIYFPVLGDFITAEAGGGAYINGKKIKLSNTKKLKDAYIGTGTTKRFIQQGKIEALLKISKAAMATRSSGNFNLKLFLEGKVDALVESYGAIHDYAAPAIIVEEAGGRFSDHFGKFNLKNYHAVFSNGHLHNQILNLLKSK